MGEESKLMEERMIKWFDFEHLTGNARSASSRFSELASVIVETIPRGPERTVCLRKLLEAKDAAVRAVVHPGG